MLMFWGGKERIPLALKFQVRSKGRRQSSERSLTVPSANERGGGVTGVMRAGSTDSYTHKSDERTINSPPRSPTPMSTNTPSLAPRRRGNIADPGEIMKRRASVAMATKVSGVRRRGSVAFSEFNANNISPTEDESIYFSIDVKSGIRCDWCIIRVKGTGPLYRKSLHAVGSSFLSFLFPVWLRQFVSLTSDRLSFRLVPL